MNVNANIPRAWTNYVTQTNLGLEVIPGVLYSQKTYTSGTTRELTFYDFVQGSRPDLTNMQSANQLPNPESFLIENLRVYFKTEVQSDNSLAGAGTVLPSQFNDIVKLVNGGILQLKIGQKIYGPWPLWMLPANSFVKGAFSTGSDLLADYGQVDGVLYPLDPPLMLAPVQFFSVTIFWPAAAVTTTNEVNIQVLFDGKAARAIA